MDKHKLKWLYPGMGVKRWLALLVLGVFAIAFGVTVAFSTSFLSTVEQGLFARLEAHNWNFLVVGLVFIICGAVFIGVAIRQGIRSIISAIRPEDVPNLVEHVYKSRNLHKGPHIVTIGGGTGLSTMLRGLKPYSANLTAIVTVADDGGSSGRIREELGILPPGDIRNTLIALADTEPLMEKLFQYRFSWGEGLAGHSFGNLFIAAMTDITGDFEQSIREFSKVLAVRGKVLPSTLETVRLGAEYADGTLALGESNIPQAGKKIKRVFLDQPQAQALPEALEAIAHADVVVLGPGSLFTSVIPNLLIGSLVDALVSTSALRVYVCNVMTQPGETDGFTACDHVEALLAHAHNRNILDLVIVNEAPISATQRRKYALEGAYPVQADVSRLKALGLEVRQGNYLDQLDLVRHDSEKLAEEIMVLAGHHHNYRAI